jgi:membrane protein insertase Oxa1/YidC/SpoIIIJ
MWQDLAALTPSLVVCVAFVIGVALFLRREMTSKRRSARNAKRRSRDHQS